jgi:hypothetical protein
MSGKKTTFVTEASSGGRYAVIGLQWNGLFPELVFAIRDEKSLPEQTAVANLIGIGIGSQPTTAVIPNGSLPEQHFEQRGGRKELRPIALAIAAGISMFYSTSIMGVALRAFLGA